MAALLPYLALAGAAAAPKIGSALGDGVSGAFSKLRGLMGFKRGGIVGGRKGAPMLAVVHGGEMIIPHEMVSTLQRRSGTAIKPKAKPKAKAKPAVVRRKRR